MGLKILMLTDRMEAGGAETHIASLSRALAGRGDQVTLLCAGGRMADALEADGIRVLRIPMPTRAPLRLFRLSIFLRRLCRRERFDILHAHTRIGAFLLRALPKRARQASIVTVHAKFKSSPILRRLSYWGMHTVAVSEDLRIHTADTYGIPYGRIRVIPNGIDRTVFFPREDAFQKSRDVRILFASRLDADCSLGARLLCQIFPRLLRRFPNLTLSIAGGGNAYGEIAALAAHVNRVVRRTAVRMLGHTEDMASLLRAHEIFVGVSRAAMEAAACGCAVVLLGDEGFLGTLYAETAAAATETNLTCRGERHATPMLLEKELSRLLSDSAFRNRAAKEGAELIRTSFDLADTAEQTRALYQSILPSHTRARILIGGYVASGNLGDDMILLGTRASLSSIAPTVSITALSGHGARDAHIFGIPCIRRRAPLSIMRAMRHADAFLCGGGSLLQNKTSNRSLSYYLLLIRLAHASGCLPVLYAAGIGPLRGKRARERVAEALSHCARISLRDPDSLTLLRECGVGAPLHLGADPALLYPLPSARFVRSRLDAYSLSKHDYFCVVLKGGCAPLSELFTLLSAVSRIHRLRPVLLILDRRSDTAISESLAKRLEAPLLAPDPDTLLAVLSHARLVLCARLHAMILSSAVRTPAVGLWFDARDPKISSFAAISGQWLANADDLPSLLSLLSEILDARALLCERLSERTEALRKKAEKDLAKIAEMLYNIDSTN